MWYEKYIKYAEIIDLVRKILLGTNRKDFRYE